jgi:hypothetical protein
MWIALLAKTEFGEYILQPDVSRRLRHCAGAPGIVNAFSQLPAEEETDDLLQAAGELVWMAGSPVKLPSLRHGAAGSGSALLKLFQRTGDDKWLARATVRHARHCPGGSLRQAAWAAQILPMDR